MKYVIKEGNTFRNFYPFTINHATFEIRSGAYSILDRIINKHNLSEDNVILLVRDGIKDIISERFPEMSVNPKKMPEFIKEINMELYWDSDEGGDPHSENPKDYYLWDIICDNRSLFLDKSNFSMKIDGVINQSCTTINKEEISISKSAQISAGVILDASDGPIIIDEEVFVDIGALIKGPTYIGKKSTVNPGARLLGNVSIGPCCKVGGEIEHTIFHGYSNKQHDGYLGHSYIGEWVNLGANTNNSDLKNNYSDIKFKIGTKIINTGKMFLGCMVGDYTKTGISTMINTGTYIGLGANVFGGGFQDKFIPSFSWGKNDKIDLDKFLSTLEIVKDRRGQTISSNEINLITELYNSNKSKKF